MNKRVDDGQPLLCVYLGQLLVFSKQSLIENSDCSLWTVSKASLTCQSAHHAGFSAILSVVFQI